MFIKELTTEKPSVMLVEPNVERDAAQGVRWLDGPTGRQTLKLMGVTDEENRSTTIESERKRVAGFLSDKYHNNWMISVDGNIVGGIWVDLKSTKYIQAPTISIMLGDPEIRGKGIGRLAVNAVVEFLYDQHHITAYARHLIGNTASQRLFESAGFTSSGDMYTDDDGLNWQNLKRDLG